MIYRLTRAQVIRIHDSQTTAPLRDPGGLEGILQAPFSGFGDYEVYPTLLQKAAKYCEGFATQQVFVDGNKRTAWLSLHSFLRVNGRCLDWIADEEVEAQILQLVARDIDLNGFALWLVDHVT